MTEYDLQANQSRYFYLMKINKPCPSFRNILFVIFLFIKILKTNGSYLNYVCVELFH